MASAIVTAAEERGLRVPEDLSVIGFDDWPLAQRMRPALTTSRIVAKGKAAAAALTLFIRRFRAGAAPAPEQHRILVDLVVRDSTAPPPSR